MERRDVLKVAGLAAVSGSSCATLLVPTHRPLSEADMQGFLGRLDASMDRIASGASLPSLIPDRAVAALEGTPRWSTGNALIKKTLRSLLLVGSLHDLPEEGQAHPGVQQRLRDSMGEFDDAMLGMTDLLDGLSKTERADLAKALRDDPQLGMRVMGAIDEEAASHGVSMKRRVHLRSLSAQACSRLRQSPDLLIEEYVRKVRKVAARQGASSSDERVAVAELGEQAVWNSVVGQAVGGEADAGATPTPSQRAPLSPPPIVSGDAAPPEPVPEEGVPTYHATPRPKSNAGPAVLTAGGIVLGLGAVTFGIGIATSSAGGAGIYVATVGALLGVVGVLVLLIGLVLYAASA